MSFQIKQKKELAAKALASKDFSHYIWMHERPYRLQAFTDVMSQMSDKDYWKTLSEKK